jgi:hypothetical protein
MATEDIEALDALPTSELRERAFEKADRTRDIGFFWDLIKHLHASEVLATEDGTTGGIGETIAGAIDLVRDLLGRQDESMEPMLRARYIDYLLKAD